jgi:hypothetical protein
MSSVPDRPGAGAPAAPPAVTAEEDSIVKTIRAWFWGSLVGVALGLLFAPRRTDLLRARAGSSAASTAFQLTPHSVVGNRLTHTYQGAAAVDLPARENRVYFANAAAAEAEGYRLARQVVGAS